MSVRVYVVDDDEAICTSLRLLLETAGYQVVTFDCAEASGHLEVSEQTHPPV